mgnify:CR=1
MSLYCQDNEKKLGTEAESLTVKGNIYLHSLLGLDQSCPILSQESIIPAPFI